MIYIANFGISKAGLSTIGYTLYNTDGTTQQARTTTGVIEVGTSTGVFACDIVFSSGWEGIVLFDTGEAIPRYVSIDYTYQGYIDKTISDLPADTADAVWDELLVDHNTVNTFGRRINTWPLTPIRDSILEIVKLIQELDGKIKKKFKKFSNLLEEKLNSNFKKEFDKASKNQTERIGALDNLFKEKIETLNDEFQVFAKFVSGFSERFKLLITLEQALQENNKRIFKTTKLLSKDSEEIKLCLKNISDKEGTIENRQNIFNDISGRKAEQKDLLEVKDALIKFSEVFPTIRNSIVTLEKNLNLVAKMSSRTIDASNLEEILKEGGIFKEEVI